MSQSPLSTCKISATSIVSTVDVMSHQDLIKRFASVGLTLVVQDRPLIRSLGRGSSNIVQIDIERKVRGNRRFEVFRIYPGSEDNRLEVQGTDKRIGQLVLLVQEPSREFEEQVPFLSVEHAKKDNPDKWKETLAKNLGISNSRNIRADKNQVWVKRKTPGNKRHFLMGLDERQLFIAQLTRAVSTVQEAHRSLKTASVTLAEGNVGKATRQGEWFFLPATKEEQARIQEGLKKNLLIIEHSVPIGPFTDGAVRGGKRVQQVRGKPHTAEELIVIPGQAVKGGDWPVRQREVFVQGSVRHTDHKTVRFLSWHKVIRNNEANQGQALGIGWVD
jgi:hypothetical protein